MHFTGTIWRPPYEWDSLLLEATAGCTHHRCKFCTLYDDLPFPFRMSPLEDVEADLREAQLLQTGPMERLRLRMQGLPQAEGPRRAFLTGANPFVLKAERLERIAELIRTYFPRCETIGCFARITDIAGKTDQELVLLARAGYDGVTIGVESGDGEALAFMDKGYAPEDIITQARRLDGAGIGYHFFYLAGIAGAGKGRESAVRSAEIFNQTRPRRVGSSMLTVFPESRLYREIQAGNWTEAGEKEKLEEVRTLIERLDIPVIFAALGASNAVNMEGRLPEDRARLLSALDEVIAQYSEADLRRYREGLPHLYPSGPPAEAGGLSVSFLDLSFEDQIHGLDPSAAGEGQGHTAHVTPAVPGLVVDDIPVGPLGVVEPEAAAGVDLDILVLVHGDRLLSRAWLLREFCRPPSAGSGTPRRARCGRRK